MVTYACGFNFLSVVIAIILKWKEEEQKCLVLDKIISFIGMININMMCDFIYYQEDETKELLKYRKIVIKLLQVLTSK